MRKEHFVDETADQRLEETTHEAELMVVCYAGGVDHRGELVTICIQESLFRVLSTHVRPVTIQR